MRVFNQNENCLLALPLLHNSKEDGGKQGSSYFDEKLILIGHKMRVCPVTLLRATYLEKSCEYIGVTEPHQEKC